MDRFQGAEWTPFRGATLGRSGTMRLESARGLDTLSISANLRSMTAVIDAPPRSPIGSTSEEAAARRRRRSAAYEAEESRLAAYRSIAATVIHGRGVRGWTQRRLAEEIGTTHTVVSRIESGRHAVSVDTLLRLSEALGVTFSICADAGPATR